MAKQSPAPETSKRRGRPHKTQPTTPTPRAKRAYIELFVDEGTACICHAFPAEQYEAHDVGDSDLFNAMAGDPTEFLDDDAEDDKLCAQRQQEATLAVLGWLWQHSYASATWGEQVYGEGKPPWAAKDTYEWGEAPTSPDPNPTTKKEDTMSSTPTPPDPTTRAENYAARLRATTADSSEFKEIISEADTEAVKASPSNLRNTNTTTQISFADGSALYLTPGKGGITTWRVVAPIPAKDKKPIGEQRLPLVGEFVVPPSSDVSRLAYITRINNTIYYGYRWLKFTEGNNNKNYFSAEAALSLGGSGNKVFTAKEFAIKYPFLVEPLQHRKDHPSEDILKTLTAEAQQKAFEAFTSKPEYQTEVAEAAKLYPELLKIDLPQLESAYTVANDALEPALKKRDKAIEKANEAIADAHLLYNTTKKERDEAKAAADVAKKEQNRISMKLGQCWFKIKELAKPTGQWSAWLTSEAAKICKGINKEQVLEQLKMYEEWHLLVPQEELRNAIIEEGVKATKRSKETAKEVLAEMAVEAAKAAAPEAAKAGEGVPSGPAPDEATGDKPPAVDTLPQQVAELVQQPMSEESKKRISEVFAQKVEQRTKSKVTAIRSASGQLGGAGNKADKTLAPITIDYTPEGRLMMSYDAISKHIVTLPKDEQHNWLVELCCRCFGLGLGEYTDLTISPIVMSDWENPHKASYTPFSYQIPLVQTDLDEIAETARKRPQPSKETPVQKKKGAAS